MCELIKRRQRNDKTRFSCFHDAKIQHRKSSFWAWVGFVAKKLGKSSFSRFRWVSRVYNIYLYILYLYVDLKCELTFLKILIFKINIVSPPWEGDIHYIYKQIRYFFSPLYIRARKEGGGGVASNFEY